LRPQNLSSGQAQYELRHTMQPKYYCSCYSYNFPHFSWWFKSLHANYVLYTSITFILDSERSTSLGVVGTDYISIETKAWGVSKSNGKDHP